MAGNYTATHRPSPRPSIRKHGVLLNNHWETFTFIEQRQEMNIKEFSTLLL